MRRGGVTAAVLLAAALCAGTAAATEREPEAHAGIQVGMQEAIGRTVDRIVASGMEDAGAIAGMADALLQLAGGDRRALLAQLVTFLAEHPGNEPAMGTALLIDSYGFSDEEKIEGLTPLTDSPDARRRDAAWNVLLTVESPPAARFSVQRVLELEAMLRDGSGAGAVRERLAELAEDELWWIRRFAARIVGRWPGLAAPELATRLADDPDPRVRQALLTD